MTSNKESTSQDPTKDLKPKKPGLEKKKEEILLESFDTSANSFKKGVNSYNMLLKVLDAYNVNDPAVKNIILVPSNGVPSPAGFYHDKISEKATGEMISLNELSELLFLCTAADLQATTGFDTPKLRDTFLDFELSKIVSSQTKVKKSKELLKAYPKALKILEVFGGDDLQNGDTIEDYIASIKDAVLNSTNKIRVMKGLIPLSASGQPKSWLFENSYRPLIVGGMLLAGIAIGYNIYSNKQKD